MAGAACAVREVAHRVHRMNRWAKNGVLDRVFERLQREQNVRVKLEAVSLDSTIAKVHPDGTGAQKKAVPSPSEGPGRYDRELYKRRNEVERLFRRLKRFRRVFSRFDKLDALFPGFILSALIYDALSSVNTP